MAHGREPALVVRPRLVEQVHGARVVTIEAPGGSGKTTFVEQLVAAGDAQPVRVRFTEPAGLAPAIDAITCAVHRAGHGDLAAAMRNAGAPDVRAALDELVGRLAASPLPMVIVLDDVHHLAGAAATTIAGALADVPDRCRVVVAGRDTRAFAVLRARAGSVALDADALRMDAAEVCAVLGAAAPPTLVAEVLDATTGWCAAVAAAAQRLHRDPTWSPGSADGARALLAGIVEDAAAAHPALAALAHAPLIDPVVARIVGGAGLLDAALAAGVLALRTDDWWIVPDPIVELLAGHGELGDDERFAVAVHYRARGETRAALRLLARASDRRHLGEVAALVHWTELEALGDTELTELIQLIQRVDDPANEGMVPRARSAVAALLLTASRAVEQAAPHRRAGWLARAAELAGADGDVALLRAVQAEVARDRIAAADVDGADALAREVLASAGDDESLTRARALTTLARAEAFRCTQESFAAASAYYAEAAARFELEGETRWRADALGRRAYTTLYMAGFVHDGEAQLREALALLPTGDSTRGFWLTNYADVLDYLGQVSEARAAAREALEIGERRRDHVLIAMASWSLAWIAAHAGDHDAFLAATDAFERQSTPWVRAGQRVEFLASTAEHLAMLGDHERYRVYAARAAAAGAEIGYETPARLAEARYEAMHGDATRALALLAELESGVALIAPTGPTRIILAALAHARCGNAARAVTLTRAASDAAVALGVPDLLHRYAGPVVAQLEALLDGHAPAPATGVTTTVRLFGGFAVEIGGRDCSPPAGHPCTIVKLLALHDSMTADAVIDALWPDADMATGRSRLRNLLNRVRQRAGDVIVRDGDLLRLHPDATTDLAVFERRAAESLSGPAAERVGRARHALALYTGALLPGDVYDDWTAAPRERAKRRYLALLDLVAADAERAGDTDEAVRLLDLAITAEPLDESHHARLCALLLEQGRIGAAREVAARAVAIFDEIGHDVQRDLRRLVTV